MNPPLTQGDTPQGLLHWLPVALFGSVMGLTGLSQAWRLSHRLWATPLLIGQGIAWLAMAAFVALCAAYAIKAVSGFAHVRSEWQHPIGGALFGTPLIAALLLPLPLATSAPLLARILWALGALGMLLFAMLMLYRWLNQQQQRPHAAPPWIIPLVGMLDIPLAVPALGLQQELAGVMVFALAVGLFFAVPLFTAIWMRLLFEAPLPDALAPSLMILLAPFSVGYSAYVAAAGKVDLFAQSLLGIALFLLPVLVFKLRNLPKSCPFRVSWWAVSFPLAATANASLHFALHSGSVASHIIAGLVLALASLVIIALSVRTLHGIGRGELQRLS